MLLNTPDVEPPAFIARCSIFWCCMKQQFLMFTSRGVLPPAAALVLVNFLNFILTVLFLYDSISFYLTQNLLLSDGAAKHFVNRHFFDHKSITKPPQQHKLPLITYNHLLYSTRHFIKIVNGTSREITIPFINNIVKCLTRTAFSGSSIGIIVLSQRFF